MKKIFLLSIITAFTLVFISCSNDEDAVSNASEEEIVGVWNLTALEAINGRSETTIEGTVIPATFEAVGKDFQTVVTFSEDPQTVVSEGSYTTVLSTTIGGENQTQEQEGEDFFESEKWRLDGSILYFGADEEEIGFTIIELTDSKMSLRYELNETVESLFGVSTVTATYNMTLSK
ncbi:MAG: lipocalin family protein [Maribacter stanieri]